MANNNKNGMSAGREVGIGAGIAAVAAAAALGAYFLYGKNGKSNRRKVKGWMLKAHGEILERLENMENVTEDTYDKVVKSVLSNYKGARNIAAPELAELAADARKHWQAIKPMFKAGKNAAKKPASKAARTRKSSGKKS